MMSRLGMLRSKVRGSSRPAPEGRAADRVQIISRLRFRSSLGLSLAFRTSFHDSIPI